jgi:hypothetical protein
MNEVILVLFRNLTAGETCCGLGGATLELNESQVSFLCVCMCVCACALYMCVLLGRGPGVLHMLDKRSTTELHP